MLKGALAPKLYFSIVAKLNRTASFGSLHTHMTITAYVMPISQTTRVSRSLCIVSAYGTISAPICRYNVHRGREHFTSTAPPYHAPLCMRHACAHTQSAMVAVVCRLSHAVAEDGSKSAVAVGRAGIHGESSPGRLCVSVLHEAYG